MILLGYSLSLGYGILCLLLSFILYKLGIPKKFTRKVVHILVGFEWVILYNCFGSGIHFMAVCIIFLILLVVEYKMKMFPMISSEGDNSPGTMYYAVAMTAVSIVGCFIPKIMLPFGIGVFCTSVGDGLAGVAGQLVTKGNPRIYAEKTFIGTLTNFVASTLSAFVVSSIFGIDILLWHCMLIGILSVELELITPHGFDNITVTWSVTALAYAFMYFGTIGEYLIPILVSPIIIMFANLKGALTPGGVVAAVFLDVLVTLAFGTFGFSVLCTFFIGSIIIDKIKTRAKNKGRKGETRKRECRTYMQVLANGMVAGISAGAFLVTRIPVFIVPFVASLAEAFADTAASGIGIFADNTFDIFRWKRCKPGLSGGMSLIGTFASLVASVIISLIALSFRIAGFGVDECFIVIIAAFSGAIIDSMLGSLLQVKYKCVKCAEITESEEHCGLPTVRYSGLPVIDNDLVNFISCASSAVISTALTLVW